MCTSLFRSFEYGAHQETLRKLVEQELLTVAIDPQMVKNRIEGNLEAARVKIKDLEQLSGELESLQQSELTKAQRR